MAVWCVLLVTVPSASVANVTSVLTADLLRQGWQVAFGSQPATGPLSTVLSFNIHGISETQGKTAACIVERVATEALGACPFFSIIAVDEKSYGAWKVMSESPTEARTFFDHLQNEG